MKKFLLIFLSTMASCKSYEYSIIETKTEKGKSEKLFISGAIISGFEFKDTLMYYKLDLSAGSMIFRENGKFNIGISISCLNRDSSYSIKLGFTSLTKNVNSDTAFNFKSGDLYFTNIINQNQGKWYETSFSFIDDKYKNPVTSTILTDEQKMVEFINLFRSEILEELKRNDKVVIKSSSHLDGYFNNLTLIIARE